MNHHEIVLSHKFIPCTSSCKASPFPVILLRGLGRNMDFWMEFSTEMANFFDVLMVDFLGTGQSTHARGRCKISDFASDIIKTCEKINITKAHILGISLGGMVALEIANLCTKNKYHLHIKSLHILSSSAAHIYPKRIFFKPLIRMLCSFLHPMPRHKDFANALVAPQTLAQNPALPTIWDSYWQKSRFSLLVTIRQLWAALRYIPPHDFADMGIKIPIVFIVSVQDRLVPWQNTISLWQRYESSQLFALENLGHDLTTDAPQAIAKIIQSTVEQWQNNCEKNTFEIL
jgi:3-oxoadipate enol-lactonase